MKTNGLRYILLAGVCIILLLLGYCQGGDTQGGKTITIKDESKVTRDTTDKEIKHDPVIVEAKAKITPRPRRVLTPKLSGNRVVDSTELIDNRVTDSVDKIGIKPFTATLDTVVGKDTVRTKYDYPENTFRIEFKRASDTVQVINTTVEVTHYVQPPFYEKPLFVSGVTAAILITIFSLTK